jgi:hypothetical protein
MNSNFKNVTAIFLQTHLVTLLAKKCCFFCSRTISCRDFFLATARVRPPNVGLFIQMSKDSKKISSEFATVRSDWAKIRTLGAFFALKNLSNWAKIGRKFALWAHFLL